MSQLKSCLILCLLCLQTSLFAQLQNFEIKKKEVSNPQLDSLWKCYCLLNIEEVKQNYFQNAHSQKTLDEYIKEDSIKFFKKAFKGKTQEQYIQESLEDIKRFKGKIQYLIALKQVKKGTFPLPKYNSSAAKARYERMISSNEEDLERSIEDILDDSVSMKKTFKAEMDKLKEIPNDRWVYIFDTIQLGGNNPTLYPGEYITNANPDKTNFNDMYYGLLMDHNGTFYHAKNGTIILSMPVFRYDFWFRRLNGGTKIIIPSYQKIKNLVTDEYVSLDSLTEADLIIARENKNGVESINEYAKVSEDMIFKINSGIMYDWIDVSGSFDKVRPNASLLSDSTLYAVASQLMMQWRHFKEEGSSGSKDLIYKLITKEDYDRIKQLEKDFPQIEAEHKEAVDKGFKEWVSVSTKAYAAAYTALMGKDPQIGLSVKELKNYVILSKVPQGTTTYYKIKHLLNEKIYEITVDSKGVITAYNLIVY